MDTKCAEVDAGLVCECVGLDVFLKMQQQHLAFLKYNFKIKKMIQKLRVHVSILFGLFGDVGELLK